MDEPRTIPTLPYGLFSQRVHERSTQHHQVVKAQLELTYRCNLHCRHCYTDPYNTKEMISQELTRAEIARLLDEMQDIGIVWLNLTGGDIFMHPDFFDIYEAAYRKGFLLQLYTNGTLFTQAILDRLQAMPPFTIDISCHSVREERFDWFTQMPGSYRTFMRGIALLQQSALPYTLKTKLMEWNQDEVDELRAFTKSLDQSFHYTTSLSPRLNGDCSSLAYRISPESLRNIGQAELDVEGDEPCHSEPLLSRPESDRLFRCGCGTNTIHINARGELSTCTFQYETRVSLRQTSLREAIDRVFAELQRLHYHEDTPCRSCTVHQFCDKQPTQARWEAGSPYAPIPYACDIAHARAQTVGQRSVQHPLHKNLLEITSAHDKQATI